MATSPIAVSHAGGTSVHSPVGASLPLPLPRKVSSSSGSPTTSSRSSPPSSAPDARGAPSPNTCAMLLYWFRHAIPTILQAAGHRIRRSHSEHPVQALAQLLADGVILADLIAFLDPARLPVSVIIRASSRHSLPSASQQSDSDSTANLESSQLFTQYISNTRRTVGAVKKVVDDVRAFSRFPRHPIHGAVDVYLGNVASVSPLQDLYPAVRLAQLVIACAVYGPRHHAFRHSIWAFSSGSGRNTFMAAMTSVAQAVALPPPDVLYAAGPPPPIHPMSPPHGVLSPHMISPVPLSPGGRPPLSPTFLSSPSPLSPRAAFIPAPILSPNLNTPPISPPHMMGISPVRLRKPSPQLHHHQRQRQSLRQSPQSGSSLKHPSSSKSSPQGRPSPNQPASPLVQSPHTSSHLTSPKPPLPRPQGSSSIACSLLMPSSAPQGLTSPPPIRTDAATTAIFPTNRGSAAPLLEEAARSLALGPVSPVDDGLGIRKFSMVTEEESRSTSPPEASSTNSRTPATTDVSGELPSVSAAARTVIHREIVQSMNDLEQRHRMRHIEVHVERTEQRKQTRENFIENEPQSKRSSEEFYTPNEETPCLSPDEPSTTRGRSRVSPEPVPVASSPENLMTPPMTEYYVDEAATKIHHKSKVDERVRQSVATSITEHISRPTTIQVSNNTDNGTYISGVAAPRLFHHDSNPSSIDLKDHSYLLSPSASDVPSPSNQWQISRQKGAGHDILSPLPMFSPPAMPPTHRRTAMATQMTPPHGLSPSPPLFRLGLESPQLSISSSGAPSTIELPKACGDFRQAEYHSSMSIEPKQSGLEKSLRGHSLPPRPPPRSRPPLPSPHRSPSRSSYPPPGSSSQRELYGGKSRVSFAPTIISPGGHERPLGKPLKNRQPIQAQLSSSTLEAEKMSSPLHGMEDDNLGPSRSTPSGPSVSSLEQPPPVDNYSGLDDQASFSNSGANIEQSTGTQLESVDIAGDEDSDSDKNPSEYDDLHGKGAEYDDDVTSENEEEDIREDDAQKVTEFGAAGELLPPGDPALEENDSFLEKTTFQKVEEVVVYNSDENDEKSPEESKRGLDMRGIQNPVCRESSPLEDEGVDEGEFDDEEEYVEEELPVSGNKNDGQGMIEGRIGEEGYTREDFHRMSETPLSDMGKISFDNTENESSVPLNAITDVTDIPGVDGYVPSVADFFTPPYAVRNSKNVRNIVVPSEVPMTPPSPLDAKKIMQSISNSKLSRVYDLDETVEEDDGPVSTMEPSLGLFQKLIAVWQSADERGVKPESITSSALKQDVSSMFVPEVLESSPSRDSSIPYGHGENEREKTIAEQGESSRAIRSQGARYQRNRTSPEMMHMSRGLEKRDDTEEGTSMASFSDAFSSEDKDRTWSDNVRTNLTGGEWEAALKGDSRAGLPASSEEETRSPQEYGPTEPSIEHETFLKRNAQAPFLPSDSPLRQYKSYRGDASGVMTDGHHVKVDRRRLDWLTRELLAARDAISRKDLQMSFAETQRMEQEEILLLERQEAESMVVAMKKLLAEREGELREARTRLSTAIQSSSLGSDQGNSRNVPRTQERAASVPSSSNAGNGLEQVIVNEHAKLHKCFDECNKKHAEGAEALGREMRALWGEVQKVMLEKMQEMNSKRDEELEALRRELLGRERLISDLKQSSSDLVDQNRAMQAEASELRIQKEKTAHRYELEMAHVSAQVELVNEFSKKLHDNFRETENLRQQVLQYQDKLTHITSASGVSQRQIKELREAVTRANEECGRLRREAELAKKKGMEAVRRAEELEELRYKDIAAQNSRYPDRQDSGSFRSHEPVRPAGHNRPGGTGVNARYHGANRSRAPVAGSQSAPKAWGLIKDKISGIMSRDNVSGKRRVQTGHREVVYVGGSPSSSQSSRSLSRYNGPRAANDGGQSRSLSRSSAGQGGRHSLDGSSLHSEGQGSLSGSRSGSESRHRRDTIGVGPEISSEYIRGMGYGSDEVGRI